MSVSAVRPRRVGEILDAAIKVYLRRARTLMGLAALVMVPLDVLTAVVVLSVAPSNSATNPDRAAILGAEFALLLLLGVGSALITAACVRAVSDAYLDQPTGIGVSLRVALRRLPAMIIMLIVFWLGVLGGVFAVLIGCIWIYVGWSVAMPALLLEGRGPAQALGRSSKLVQGRWWATFGVLTVSFVMAAIVLVIIEELLRQAATLPGRPSVVLSVVAATLANGIGAVVTSPFIAAVTTILYYDLRVRKEGFDLKVLADQIELGAPASALPDQNGQAEPLPYGPEAVGRPGGPPFWPPPAGWSPSSAQAVVEEKAPAYDPNEPLPNGQAAVGRPGGPPFWPPPASWSPPPGWSPDA